MGAYKGMKKILIVGPALSFSGYGEHARFVLRSLAAIQDSVDLYLKNIPWGATSYIIDDSEERKWIDGLIAKTIQYENGENKGPYDLSLQVTIPGEWNPGLALKNIGVTAGTESSRISPQWFLKSREMDKIIVVSEHAKSAFVNTEYKAAFEDKQEKTFISKVECPVDVVGFPCKDITATEPQLDLETDFNFLIVGTLIPRKNIDNTIRWFINEFRDKEVGLVLKTSLGKNSLVDRKTVLKKIKSVVGSAAEEIKCKIYLLHGNMSEQEMNGLYRHPKIKGLINLSHGEGFGLPLFEAACAGLPVITVNWGGQVDFLNMPVKNKKTQKEKMRPMFLPVSYDVRPIQDEAVWGDILVKGSSWAFAKEWSFRKGINAFMRNYKTYESLAKKLSTHIKEEFSDEKMRSKFLNSIELSKAEEDENESITI